MIVVVKTSAGDWYLYKGEFRREKLPRTCDGTLLEGGGYISTHWPMPRAVIDLRAGK